MVIDESAVVVQKRGDVGKKVLGPVDTVRRLVAFKMIAEPHLERLHQYLYGEQYWRQLDLVPRTVDIAHALELGQLQVKKFDNGSLPFFAQMRGYSRIGQGPTYLLERTFELGREGVENLGTQGVGDFADVVDQLGRGAFCVFLQVDEARVNGTQLLIRCEGGFAGRLKLCMGLFTIAVRQRAAALGYERRQLLALAYLSLSTSASSST